VFTHVFFLYKPDTAKDYQYFFLETKISCLLSSRKTLEFLCRDFGKAFISQAKIFHFLNAF